MRESYLSRTLGSTSRTRRPFVNLNYVRSFLDESRFKVPAQPCTNKIYIPIRDDLGVLPQSLHRLFRYKRNHLLQITILLPWIPSRRRRRPPALCPQLHWNPGIYHALYLPNAPQSFSLRYRNKILPAYRIRRRMNTVLCLERQARRIRRNSGHSSQVLATCGTSSSGVGELVNNNLLII